MDCFVDFSVNTIKFPDLRGMVEWLHGRGQKAVYILNAGMAAAETETNNSLGFNSFF